MLDVCVVWGDNVVNPRLDKIDFWNGIFTCNVKTRDREAWEMFDMRALSNNHLISDRDVIRDAVQGIRIGDQIRVRGKLAAYRGPVGERGTSITRDDTGDGACETIYVEEFSVVEAAVSYWRWSMYGARAVSYYLPLYSATGGDRIDRLQVLDASPHFVTRLLSNLRGARHNRRLSIEAFSSCG